MHVNTPNELNRTLMQEYLSGVQKGILTQWTARDYIASRLREMQRQSISTLYPVQQKDRS